MRFMIIIRATPRTEAGEMPAAPLLQAMAEYHQELARAGVLLDCSGLKPSSAGWRVQFRQGQRRLVDGPFAETKELIAGFTLIDVPSREAAQEWTRRFPAPLGPGEDGEIEVRQLYELDDFAPGPALDSFKSLDAVK